MWGQPGFSTVDAALYSGEPSCPAQEQILQPRGLGADGTRAIATWRRQEPHGDGGVEPELRMGSQSTHSWGVRAGREMLL